MKKFALLLSLIVLFFGLFKPPLSGRSQTDVIDNRRISRSTATPFPPPFDLQPQIIGGNPADDGEYPWQAAIIDADQSNPYDGQFCGGSLISPAWVLTAAHCVQDYGEVVNPNQIDVVAGVNLLSSAPTVGSQGQRRKVAQIIVHPAYEENNWDNDIALLRLSVPLTMNEKVQSIPFATAADAASFAPGVMATVTGWGRTNPPPLTPIQYPNELMEVQVPIVDQSTCNLAYQGAITANMICAGYAGGGKDSCQGDSGGPLIVPDGNGGWLQAGIVSWGEGCAEPNKYGVYTRLANYTLWINLHLNPPHLTYLPLVIRQTAASTGEIPNGDFEQGDVAWTEYSSNGWDLIVNRSQLPEAIPPHNGNWAAWLGGDNNELSRLYQTITINAATPYLTFWHYIDSIDPCGLDVAGVKMNGQLVKNYLLCASNNTLQWQKQTVNLQSYAGQSAQLEFFVQTTATTNNGWLLDDITLQSSP